MTGLFVVHTGLYVLYAFLSGLMEVDLFLLFRTALITAILVIIMIVQDRFTQLKVKLERTIGIKDSRKELFDVPPLETDFSFPSALQSDQLTIRIKSLVLVRSASNYVEVFWVDADVLHKQLVRSTLRETEQALKAVPFVVRCHRTCLVNRDQVVRLKETAQGLKLKLRDFPELVPVSRNYAMAFKGFMGASTTTKMD
jgi:DNA-binding LytR/AlgR family response regulator